MPPNQSPMIVAALEERGVPVAYIELEGEQHGFRKAETIMRAFEAELAFQGRVFGFVPAGGAGGAGDTRIATPSSGSASGRGTVTPIARLRYGLLSVIDIGA